MTNLEKRQLKAKLHYQIMNVIFDNINGESDTQYFYALLYALEIITNSLRQFDDIEIPAVQEEQEEEE